MKVNSFFVLLFVLLVVVAFAATPVYAQAGETIPGLELTAAQIILVGMVASGLTSGIRLLIELAARAKIEWRDEYMQIIVYLAGGILSYLFFPQALPAWPTFGPDLGSNITLFMDQWLAPSYTAMTAWFVTATIFYHWFIQSIYQSIGARMAPTVFKKPGVV